MEEIKASTKEVELTKKNLAHMKERSEVADFFKVMGDLTRLNILIALIHHEYCVSDLVYILDMTQSAVSHQLKILRTSKLVKSRRDGRVIYYSLDDEHIEAILDMALAHAHEK